MHDLVIVLSLGRPKRVQHFLAYASGIKHALLFLVVSILSWRDRDVEGGSEGDSAVKLLHNLLNLEICQIIVPLLIGFPGTIVVEIFLILVPEL